ncbi:MAG: tetratricopeptide repeat protein [Kiritimatiellaeota bacterium]|nr:tetratricopeptide repeat protein [Kiritimatiellota bacterium]
MKTHPTLIPCLAAALLLAGCGANRKLIEAGQTALEENKPKNAAADFERAARRVTRDPALYYNLASAHRALDNLKPAMGAVEKGLRLEPGNARLLQLKAHIAFTSGDWQTARDALDAALENGAPEPYVLNARAAIARMEDKPDHARLLLLDAMRLDPAYPATTYNLASLYYARHHDKKLLPQAHDLFEMHLRQSPLAETQASNAAANLEAISKLLAREEIPQNRNTSLSAQRMAEAARFAAARNWTAALRAYTDAVNADPLSLDARLALAAYLESRDDPAGVANAHIEAAKLMNAPTDVLYKAAEAALTQRRADVAAEFSSRGLANAPGNLRFYYQMARIRARQNMPAEARAYAEYYARFAPEPHAGQVAAWAKSLGQ